MPEVIASATSTSHGHTTHRRHLLRQPLALQWFEGGVLKKRSEEERQAGRFELFLDLLYVAIVANFADALAEDVSFAQVVKYILILTPSWHIWSDLRELMNSFYNDDLAQRVFILWIMTTLVLYGNNAVLVDKDLGALRVTLGAYIAGRFSSMTAHLLYSFASYHHRAQQRLWFCMSGLTLFIWIPLFFEHVSLRHKAIIATIAIIVEESTWIFCYSPVAKKLIGAKYTTAVDMAHEIDRFAAFFIIVLGEFLYSIIVGHPAAIGFNLGLMRAVWTLILAFCLNWLYAHCDGSLKSEHPMRHSIYAAFAWVTMHLPLIASLLAGGHIAAVSVKEGDEHLLPSQLWLLCGGLGTGLLCLWVIALLHRTDDDHGVLLLPKHARLILRPIIAVVIIALPLTSLRVTAVLTIIMALMVICLVWENVTSLIRGHSLWEPWINTEYPDTSSEEAGSPLLDDYE